MAQATTKDWLDGIQKGLLKQLTENRGALPKGFNQDRFILNSITVIRDMLRDNKKKKQLQEIDYTSIPICLAKGAFLEREKPVTLRIIARYLPPKSVSKKRKLDMLEGRELPLKKPDMDNIVKVVADALNGVAYHDDTQIALVQAKKCYSAVEGLDVTVEEYTG